MVVEKTEISIIPPLFIYFFSVFLCFKFCSLSSGTILTRLYGLLRFSSTLSLYVGLFVLDDDDDDEDVEAEMILEPLEQLQFQLDRLQKALACNDERKGMYHNILLLCSLSRHDVTQVIL